MFSRCRLYVTFLSVFFFFSCCVLGNENDEFYEGWTWKPSLTVTLPNKKELDFTKEHEVFSAICKDKGVVGYLSASKRDPKNIALIRLSVIIKKGDEYEYRNTNCFQNLIFISGSEVREKREDNSSLIKFKEYYKVEPTHYSFKPSDIQAELAKRFASTEGSVIHPAIYSKIHDIRISAELPVSFLSPNLSLDQLQEQLRYLQAQLNYLHDRHSHSEQKMLFFLDKSLASTPAYWNYGIERAINEAIEKVENLAAVNHHFFERPQREDNLRFFLKNILAASSKEAIKESFKQPLEIIEQESQPIITIPQMKEEATRALEEIDRLLYEVDRRREGNPTNLSPLLLNEDGKIREARHTLVELRSIISQPPYTHINRRNTDLDILDGLRQRHLLQKMGDEDWLYDIKTSFLSLASEESIEGVVLHLHSLNDICENCAPSLARELERNDGFIARFKSLVSSFNPNQINPIFKITASCGQIRESCRNRWECETFNQPKEENEVMFHQVFLQK